MCPFLFWWPLFARSLLKCWKPRASPSVFNTSLGTLRMLMNGKSCLIPLLQGFKMLDTKVFHVLCAAMWGNVSLWFPIRSNTTCAVQWQKMATNVEAWNVWLRKKKYFFLGGWGNQWPGSSNIDSQDQCEHMLNLVMVIAIFWGRTETIFTSKC